MTLARSLHRTSASSEHFRARAALLELAEILEPTSCRLGAGELLFRAGDHCAAIHVLDAGLMRLGTADGAVAGFRFRGDWVGIESLAAGRHGSTAQAMDTCVVWSLSLGSLAATGLLEPAMVDALVGTVHVRNSSADAGSAPGAAPEHRLAQFLLSWADTLVRDGRGESQLGLRVTRAELAAYLGMAHGTVERALSILCAAGVVDCDHGRRHEIRLDDRVRLRAYAAGGRLA